MCHLSVPCCPSRNSTRNPPAIHAQANPTLRPRPCPPPCSVFRLGFFSSRNSNTQKAKAKTPNTHTPPARSGLLFLPLPCGVFGGVTIHPQSTHNPRTSNPDLAPEASPSSLLGVSPWLFFLPQFQHTKSQGKNTEHPHTARKVGFAFSPAPIRLVRGCWGCESKWWCDWNRFLPWQRFFPPAEPPFMALVLVASLCGSLAAAAAAALSLCW